VKAQIPKRPPIKVLKIGVGPGGGAIQECEAIRRMIRIDSLPHQPMTNPAFGLDFVLNGPLPKAVLDGVATPEQAEQYEIVERPEI
jgi:hypothetical protein